MFCCREILIADDSERFFLEWKLERCHAPVCLIGTPQNSLRMPVAVFTRPYRDIPSLHQDS